MYQRLLLPAALAAALLAGRSSSAAAEPLEKIARQLIAIDAEVVDLGQGLRRPDSIGRHETDDLASRRLIDAKVNFGVGNYDDAAVMLYDFVQKNAKHPSWDEGLYYLAESLFQKGDYVASRSYFTRLVSESGRGSKFYQQGLERLIELTLKLDDSTKIDQWLSALDQVPQGELRDSVPYVRGKYSYFRNQFDESIKHFEKIPETSKYYSQARYFLGASLVAKRDLGGAADVFKSLSLHRATTKDERRISELSHMALGRLFYERDQPSKAVDQYLRISRRSDLFDEALYEVTWVYVKNRQFDKALRALELLALADPTSERMPDVRILEGNLRIRKAQRILEEGQGNSKEQYDKAVSVFKFTRENFRDPHDKLQKIIADHGDARAFLTQITGRSSSTFEVSSTLPEVAAAWLRQQPEVARVVDVETDLGQIEDEIAEAEQTVKRLEVAINTPSRVNIFPSLAKKRFRSTEILENTVGIRTKLVQAETSLVSRYLSSSEQSQLMSLQKLREGISSSMDELPDGEVSESERVGKARNRLTDLSERAAEVSTVIDATEATLVALEKYVRDQGSEIKPEQVGQIDQEMKKMRSAVDEMRSELALIRSDAVLAKDRAGTGDEASVARAKGRKDLRKALNAEHAFMEQVSGRMSFEDRSKMQNIERLMAQSLRATLGLDRVNDTIDSIVEDALREVRSALEEEKAQLVAYRREFSNYELESRGLGGEILVQSFQNVSNKFYDILIRSDVGIVDVAWSLKEGAETSLKRLNLDQARERRTLNSNFADVIRDIRIAKAQELFDRAAGK